MNQFFIPTPFQIPRKRTTKTKKHKFTKEDDAKLIKLVAKYGCRWSIISKEFKGRNARQCRDRWNHYLDPNKDHSEWTSEEDRLLTSCYRNYGNRWSIIAERFPNRTSVSIRNRCCKLFKLNDKNRFNFQQFACLMPAPDPDSDQLMNQITNMSRNFNLPNDEFADKLFFDESAKNDEMVLLNSIRQESQTIQTSQPNVSSKSLNCYQNQNVDQKVNELPEKLKINCNFSVANNNSKMLLPSIDSFPFPY